MKTKQTRKPKKKMRSLDKYLIFCFTVLIIYTIVSLVILAYNGTEASTLTVSFFGVFGGEVFACALLKSLKIKHEKKEDEFNE